MISQDTYRHRFLIWAPITNFDPNTKIIILSLPGNFGKRRVYLCNYLAMSFNLEKL